MKMVMHKVKRVDFHVCLRKHGNSFTVSIGCRIDNEFSFYSVWKKPLRISLAEY